MKNNGIVTHDGLEYHGIGTIIYEKNLVDIDVSQYHVIAIDELQFYDRPSVMKLIDWANSGKIVLAAALSGDANQENFGYVYELFPHAEHIKKLSAICGMCQMDASFTKCLINKQSQVSVGGSEQYIPVCRLCLRSQT
jgi:thymidine kinase